MADLRETRRKLKIAMITMAGIDIVALIILLSPLVGSGESRKQEMQQLQTELRQKTRQVEPLRGLDKKVVLASQEIDTFYNNQRIGRGRTYALLHRSNLPGRLPAADAFHKRVGT
jgi:hypothetical protein